MSICLSSSISYFLSTHHAPPENYTLSLHDALPICYGASAVNPYLAIETLEDMANKGLLPEGVTFEKALKNYTKSINKGRSEEHTSELQSHSDLVCRLLLEKKKKNINKNKQTIII